MQETLPKGPIESNISPDALCAHHLPARFFHNEMSLAPGSNGLTRVAPKPNYWILTFVICVLGHLCTKQASPNNAMLSKHRCGNDNCLI